jgi:hypothetical protein
VSYELQALSHVTIEKQLLKEQMKCEKQIQNFKLNPMIFSRTKLIFRIADLKLEARSSRLIHMAKANTKLQTQSHDF